jgi:penicillin-binding protein 1A
MKNVTGGTLPAQIWKTVMKVAEEGLPAKSLDRSAPQEAIDEDGMELTSQKGFNSDDEAAVNRTPSFDSNGEPQKEQKKTGSFLNWLVGDGEKPKPQNENE